MHLIKTGESTPFILHQLYITRYTYKGAAEQKARSTYEYLIDLAEDPAVLAPLRFLREREIVHFQRFGEALDIARVVLPKYKSEQKSSLVISSDYRTILFHLNKKAVIFNIEISIPTTP